MSALAPAVAALTGSGVVALARWARASWAGLAALAARGRRDAHGVAVDAAGPHAGLRAGPAAIDPRRRRAWRSLASVALRLRVARAPRRSRSPRCAAALALTAGPAAYSVATVRRSLNANDVLAGPASAGAGFGGGGRRRPRPVSVGRARLRGGTDRRRRPASSAALAAGGGGVGERASCLPRGPPGLGEVPRRRERLA